MDQSDRSRSAAQDRNDPVTVFVHGLADDATTWSPLLLHLTGVPRPIFPTLPWRTGGDDRWRRRGRASDHLRTELIGIGGPRLLVGHSFGANAVLEMLAEDAEGVRGAVLISPAYHAPDCTVSWSLFDKARAAFERQFADALRSRIDRELVGDQARRFDEMAARALDRCGPSGFLAAFDQIVASGHGDLESIPCPVLVVSGERDEGMLRDQFDDLCDRLPRVSRRWDPVFDHVPHLGEPTRLAALVHEFVAAHVDPEGHRA